MILILLVLSILCVSCSAQCETQFCQCVFDFETDALQTVRSSCIAAGFQCVSDIDIDRCCCKYASGRDCLPGFPTSKCIEHQDFVCEAPPTPEPTPDDDDDVVGGVITPSIKAYCPNTYTNDGFNCVRAKSTYAATGKVKATCPSGFTNSPPWDCLRLQSVYGNWNALPFLNCPRLSCASGYYPSFCQCIRPRLSISLTRATCPSGKGRADPGGVNCFTNCNSGYTLTIFDKCSRPKSVLNNRFTCGSTYTDLIGTKCYKPCTGYRDPVTRQCCGGKNEVPCAGATGYPRCKSSYTIVSGKCNTPCSGCKDGKESLSGCCGKKYQRPCSGGGCAQCGPGLGSIQGKCRPNCVGCQDHLQYVTGCCGNLNQRPCYVSPWYGCSSACATGLQSIGGKCIVPCEGCSDGLVGTLGCCGKQGQRGCAAATSSCDTCGPGLGLIGGQQGCQPNCNFCSNDPFTFILGCCGGEGQRSCDAGPCSSKCEEGLVDSLGFCRTPGGWGSPCGPLNPCISEVVVPGEGSVDLKCNALSGTCDIVDNGHDFVNLLRRGCRLFSNPLTSLFADAANIGWWNGITLDGSAAGGLEVTAGVYYGPNGEYGCFVSGCATVGFQLNVGASTCQGFFLDGIDGFNGTGYSVGVAFDLNFIPLGLGVGLDFADSDVTGVAPVGANICLGVGVGNPIAVASGFCHTELIDATSFTNSAPDGPSQICTPSCGDVDCDGGDKCCALFATKASSHGVCVPSGKTCPKANTLTGAVFIESRCADERYIKCTNAYDSALPVDRICHIPDDGSSEIYEMRIQWPSGDIRSALVAAGSNLDCSPDSIGGLGANLAFADHGKRFCSYRPEWNLCAGPGKSYKLGLLAADPSDDARRVRVVTDSFITEIGFISDVFAKCPTTYVGVSGTRVPVLHCECARPQ